jgi:hypothetical protein
LEGGGTRDGRRREDRTDARSAAHQWNVAYSSGRHKVLGVKRMREWIATVVVIGKAQDGGMRFCRVRHRMHLEY